MTTKELWLLFNPPAGGVEEEESDNLKDLIKEGDEIDDTKDDKDESKGDDEGKKDDDKGDDEGEKPDVSALEGRLDNLETKLAEKDAEIVFLRGEVAKKGQTEKKVEVDDDDTDIEGLSKLLTDRDPKVAAKAVIDLANKIADKKLKGIRDETTTMLTTNEAVRAAKEDDRKNVLDDFGDYLDDKEFADTMAQVFTNQTKAAGGRYVRDSLYSAAAVAQKIIDKSRAAKGKGKNGVVERKGKPIDNPVDNDSHDYSKATTIDGLPDSVLSAKEKSAAKGALKKMQGVTEKQWVENFIAQQNEAR